MNIDIIALLQDACFSALAAMGFAMLFNVPRRILWVCVLGGAIGHPMRDFLMMIFPNSLILATLFACVTVGIYAQYCAWRLQIPASIFQVTGAITMVPGIFAYQAMLGMLALGGIAVQGIQDPLLHFSQNLVTTGILLGAITFGSLSPGLLFNRVRPVV